MFSILIFLVVGETDEECDARSPARAVLLIDILSSVFSLQVPSVTTLFPLTMDGFVGISAASASTLVGGLCLCESVSFCLPDVVLLEFPGGRYTSRFSVSDLCASDREEDNNCVVANDAADAGIVLIGSWWCVFSIIVVGGRFFAADDAERLTFCVRGGVEAKDG